MLRNGLVLVASVACLLTACGDDDAVEGSPDAKGRDGGSPDGAARDAFIVADAGETDASQEDATAPDANDVGDASVPLDEYAMRIAPAYCALYVGCCTTEELRGLFRSAITTREQCVRALMGNLTENLNPAKKSGGIDFDEEAAGECLDTLAGLGCTDFAAEVRRNELCTGVLDPQLANGEKCQFSIECSSQLCHDGFCTAPGGVEDACGGEDPVCSPGLFCVQGACARRLANESECTSGGQCLSNYCGAGKRCEDPPIICDGRSPDPR